MADGGILCGQCAGEERHQAPEAFPQLLHTLLQSVDVCVQIPPAALHLRQHIIHQVLHLRRDQCAVGGKKRIQQLDSFFFFFEVLAGHRCCLHFLSYLVKVHKCVPLVSKNSLLHLHLPQPGDKIAWFYDITTFSF